MASRFHEEIQDQGQQYQHSYEHVPGRERFRVQEMEHADEHGQDQEGQGQGHGQGQGQGQGQGNAQGYGQGYAQVTTFDAQSINSMSSSQTLVQASMGPNKVFLTLEQMEELPSVPYKLRHALTADEWVRRMQVISTLTEKSTHPGYELIYFFIFCIGIPGGIAYPIFRVLLTRNGRTPWVWAMVIASSISFGMFLLFFTPLLVRKWVLQRRMNKDVQAWARNDQCKLSEKDQSFKVRWRVRLPWVFGSETQITIPIPPRPDDAPSTLHSRHVSAEAATWNGVPRGDSNTNRSMFENA